MTREGEYFLIALMLIITASPLARTAHAAEPIGIPWTRHVVDDSSQGADGVKLADINGDGLVDIATGWEEGGVTRVYINPGAKKSKSKWPKITVGETPSVEDATFVDFDQDGHLDVISCCEGATKQIFVHWAPSESGALLDANKWQQEVLTTRQDNAQQWMFAWPMQVDGRHGVDLVAGSKGDLALLGWFEAPANGRDLSSCQWHSISAAGWIMSIWKRDMDGDQDLDLVITDRTGRLRGCRWLENPGPGPDQRLAWENHAMCDGSEEVLSMDLADLDGDHLEDAVVAVKDMAILFLKRLDESGQRWETHRISADYDAGNTRAVAVADINSDQNLDLAVTTWNARGKHGVFWLEFEQTEQRWVAHQISGKAEGIKYDRIEMLDLDDDGDLDLLTCEEREGGVGLGVIWYENPLGIGRNADGAALNRTDD